MSFFNELYSYLHRRLHLFQVHRFSWLRYIASILVRVAVNKLHASKPTKDYTPPNLALGNAALLALLRSELQVVFARLGPSFSVAELYGFAMALNHAIW
jgi:hypothetical protein